MAYIVLGTIVKLNVSSEPFCIKMFPDVIYRVIVLQKLEFTTLWAWGKFLAFFKL